MQILKKLALVLCFITVLNTGISFVFPGNQAAAAPAAATTAGTADTCADEKTLSTCLTAQEGPDTSQCYAGSHTGLEWLFCPISMAIGKFADTINNAVQGLLDFPVNSYLADSTTTKCGPDSCQVNKAWTIIKNVASGLVVVLMLIMVISQAIGGQVFDAYTVKKMLPRLAIAVILMQFSWVLSKFAITTVNDIAQGIKDIMLAPFGGPQNMTLSAIMNHLNPAFPVATSWAIIGVLFLLLLTPLSTFILPIFLFVAIAVGGSAIVGVATLIFRDAFIVMAVIFAPIALLLWATPGQTFQGLWRKYADNIMKMLFLFPLIMAMIYAGRIVAWVTAGLSGKSDVLSFFVILICFFTPYIILPKTFRWGGQILATVNQQLNNNGVTRWTRGWAYGRVRAEAARRSAVVGKDYDAADNYLRMGRKQFKANHLWQRGGRLNPLALLTTKAIKEKDENGIPRYVGRRGRKMYQFQGRKLAGLTGGALLDGGLSREGMLRRSEQAKKEADEANATLVHRAEETGRNRKFGGYRIMKNADGSIGALAIEKGGRYSWMAGMARATRMLNKSGWRVRERAAEEIINDPNFAVFHEDMVALDPNGDMQKGYDRFRKKHGLKKNFDANDRREQNYINRMQDLELEKQANPSTFNRDRDKVKELEELSFWHNIRRAGGVASDDTGADRTAQAEDLERTKQENPEALVKVPGLEDSAVRLIKITDHDPVQKKATSSGQTKQSIASMDPLSNPDVVAKMGDRPIPAGQPGYGGRMKVTDNGHAPQDQGLYNSQDSDHYGWKEQVSAQNIASAHERFFGDRAQVDAERRRNIDLPLQTVDNMGENTLMWATPGAKWFKDAFDLKDGQAAGLLAHILRVPSTRQYFNQWMSEGMPNPADIPRLQQHMQQHPESAGVIKNSMQEMYRIRRSMGIADHDSRPIVDRDWRILSDTLSRQLYDPDWTPEKTRLLYDSNYDREGYEDPQPVGHQIPPDFLPQPTQTRPLTQGQQTFVAGLSRYPGGNANMNNPRNGPPPGRAVNPTAGTRNVFAPNAPGAPIPGAPPPGLPFDDQVNYVLNRFHGGPRPQPLPPAAYRQLERIHQMGMGGPGRAPGTRASYGNYPREVLKQKRDAARQLGLDDQEILELIGTGVLGASEQDAMQSELRSLMQQQSAALEANDRAKVAQLDTQIKELMPPLPEPSHDIVAAFDEQTGGGLSQAAGTPAQANVEFAAPRTASRPAAQGVQPTVVVAGGAITPVAPAARAPVRTDPKYFQGTPGLTGPAMGPLSGYVPLRKGQVEGGTKVDHNQKATAPAEGEGMRHMHEEARAKQMRDIELDAIAAQNRATEKYVQEAVKQAVRQVSPGQRAIEGDKAIANQHINSEGIGDRAVQKMANRKVL